jgi:hypothetical protein
MASMLLHRSSSGDILSGLCRRDGCGAQIGRWMNRASGAGAQASFRKAGIPRLIVQMIASPAK